ncbi:MULTISPECIES: hypothetical protein [unclassified Arcicella]|uniref:hypothetical protein n=1 Tax=unclassified Arcicella TaxID=2644986 RepID=UPI0028650AA6|nr:MULTISPECIES: hypothetical protein [unclassified Arcicella]MDR6564155.1 hypothetical protein [Arcicella sp. BE51]MDR6813908.1 hypothetical protein [Arcicella sp. BE140]MDR6825220.1 hypothetical protein [Arcicella sp. BE139]
MKKIILLFSTILLFASCVSHKLINVNSSEIIQATQTKNVAYLEPLSFVSLIEKGNKTTPNDSLSLVSKMLLDSIISNNNNFKITQKINILDERTKETVDVELSNIFLSVIRSNKIEGLKLTPIIDSVLKSNKQKFVLATIATGFGRRKGNYGGQIAKAVGIGVLTLGMYAPAPIKANTTLYAIIIDTEKNEIVYFSKGISVEKSPTEREVLEKQYKNLFDGYLYNIQQPQY